MFVTRFQNLLRYDFNHYDDTNLAYHNNSINNIHAGSTKYVHEECLIQWIKSSQEPDNLSCNICKFKLVYYFIVLKFVIYNNLLQ